MEFLNFCRRRSNVAAMFLTTLKELRKIFATIIKLRYYEQIIEIRRTKLLVIVSKRIHGFSVIFLNPGIPSWDFLNFHRKRSNTAANVFDHPSGAPKLLAAIIECGYYEKTMNNRCTDFSVIVFEHIVGHENKGFPLFPNLWNSMLGISEPLSKKE